MKSVPFSERERDGAGLSGTVDVFGPYCGEGENVRGRRRDKKRHLSLQLEE